MKFEKQKTIKEEINSLFPEICGDVHRKKQRFLYNYLRMKDIPKDEVFTHMQKQNLYP